MADPKPCAGIVPSSGASTRMGRDKGLLEVEGRTFLRRTIHALTEGGCEPVLVVVAEGEDEMAQEAEAAGAVVLVNPEPGEGPITSLRIALSALDHSVSAVAYLPVDHPLVKPSTIRELLEAVASKGATLAIPTYHGERGHPALFGQELFVELLDPDLEGGARTVVHRHLADALLVEVDDEGVVTDIDTPEIYRAVVDGTDDAGDDQ
ncbi:MAG: nucleotidyltransferase family protein [Gemmatimonadota bacterium]